MKDINNNQHTSDTSNSSFWFERFIADLSTVRPFNTVKAYRQDLVLWLGIPAGLAISAWLIGWGWRRFRAVRSAENAMLILFLTDALFRFIDPHAIKADLNSGRTELDGRLARVLRVTIRAMSAGAV